MFLQWMSDFQDTSFHKNEWQQFPVWFYFISEQFKFLDKLHYNVIVDGFQSTKFSLLFLISHTSLSMRYVLLGRGLQLYSEMYILT